MSGNALRHQAGLSGGAGSRHYDGLPQSLTASDCLDLAGLDAEAAQLDLLVETAE